MDAERWQKIETLYHSALGLEAGERAGWLGRVCAGDEGIKQDVLSLLESADTEDSFLEEPVLSFGLEVIARESESLLGEVIGRYEILETLGRGGMGEVYLGRDPRLNRLVALKLLPASITDDRERVRRFEREARAASAISHPNVAHIYEMGEANGRHYITMEYIKGQTLRKLLRNGALDADKSIEIAIQIGMALSAAHRAGVIHRDIKPENIILADDGYVKVLDFGLAKLIEGADTDSEGLLSSIHTGPELFMGTSHYMSPEQVRRQPIDLRTDLWSLGVVVYEMLTYRRPFQGPSFSEVIVAILEREPDLSVDESANLAPAIREFLRKVLKKRPEERYQSADDLLNDLRGLQRQTGRPSRTRMSGALPKRASKPDRDTAVTAADPIRAGTIAERYYTVVDEDVKHRSILSLLSKRVVFALAGLLAVTAAVYFGFNRAHPVALAGRPINLRFERLNLTGTIIDIAMSPDGKYVATVMSDGGNDTVHIMELATNSDLTIVPASGKPYSALSFSPDSNYVYYLENETETGTLYRVSKLGGGQRKISANVNTAATFSPDGQHLAFVRHDLAAQIPSVIITKSDGTAEQVLATRTHSDSDPFVVDLKGAGPAWSPDGKTVACPTVKFTPKSQEMNLEVLDASTGKSRRLNTNPWYDISEVAWLADTSGLVLAAKDTIESPWQLKMLSYPGGEARPITNDPNNYTQISGRSESSLFATINVEENSNISLLTSDDGKTFTQTILNQKGVSEIVWGGTAAIVYSVNDGKYTNLWVRDPAGKTIRQLTFESNDNYHPAISPDGRQVAFISTRAGGPNIWLVDLDGTHPKQLTTGGQEEMPSFTPDGRWLIFRTAKGVRKVSIDGGTPAKLFDKTALYPSVSPDGRKLAYFSPAPPDGKTWRLEVLDFESLKMMESFDLPQTVNAFFGLRWNPKGDALTFISSGNGAENLWQQPLAAGQPKRLTDFRDSEIRSFAWSPTGQQLVCVRHGRTLVPLLVRLF